MLNLVTHLHSWWKSCWLPYRMALWHTMATVVRRWWQQPCRIVDRAFTAARGGLKARPRSELARSLCLYDAFTGHGMAWREWQTDPKGFFASINVYSSSSRPKIEAAATASIGPKMPRVCFVFFKQHEH